VSVVYRRWENNVSKTVFCKLCFKKTRRVSVPLQANKLLGLKRYVNTWYKNEHTLTAIATTNCTFPENAHKTCIKTINIFFIKHLNSKEKNKKIRNKIYQQKQWKLYNLQRKKIEIGWNGIKWYFISRRLVIITFNQLASLSDMYVWGPTCEPVVT